jgi:osmotically-inducible protein OsmY
MDTDAQLLQSAAKEFKNSPVLHYARLTLHVQDGILTISGRVNTFAERRAVERTANRVAGIKKLVLEIRAAAIPMTVSHEDGPIVGHLADH